MTYDIVIRGGDVIARDGRFTGDIAVSGGRIVALGAGLGPADREIDARGRIVTPGGVDPHCHIEQLSGMGLVNADTFETATAAAAMGGTTTLISFAAQMRGERPSDTVAAYAERARRGARVDHAFHFSVADPAAPHFHDDLMALAAEGHRSIKVFTTYAIGLGDAQILSVMDSAREAGALVCVHCETDAIVARERARLLAAGRTRPFDHAASRPREAEAEAVHRICRFAVLTGARVMIFHVTCIEALEEVRAARARGAPVLAETCTHYLFQTEADLDRPGVDGAKWMCSPPQRAPEDRDALWEALARGDLALVSSDHAPYRFDASGKLAAGEAPPFDRIANGQPGLELRLPLLFNAMVTKGRLGPHAFVELTAAAPARLYGLPGKGDIAPGMDADLVIWDPGRTHTYGADDLHDNAGYNPFEGHTVTGWPERVLLRGETIVDDGVLLAEPGSGRWIARPEPGAPR
ncbi:MAG: dihydropyrimidinase [Paracoccaceae bacterium]|jgi:dihydropyrimidinase|nr:dihydropyrimidinase [Paracoccaceae bacterium]